MKKVIYAIFISFLLGGVLAPAAVHAWADGEAPWGAPVMPGGKVVKTERTVQYIEYDQPYEKVLAFYKDALTKYPDEMYRDWADQMYIEDQGGASWHSIGIPKGTSPKTTVKITRDNLTWIFSTLVIRFIGVFLVLCILWIFLNVNSAVMKKFFPEKKKA